MRIEAGKSSLLTMIFVQSCVSAISASLINENFAEKSKRAEDDDDTTKVSYNGYQLWKLNTDTPEKVNMVKDLDIVEVTRWGVNSSNSDVLINPINIGKVRNELVKKNMQPEVLIYDLQKEIESHPITDTNEMKLSQKIESFNLSSYHNVPVIYNYLHMLARKHNHIKLKTIGRTMQGNDIKLVIIANEHNKNGIFVEAGMHAREWVSPAAVLYIISQFANHFHLESSSIQKLNWYFLPLGNPDGYIYSYTKNRLWRKNRSKWGNCFGTDLNRNFGFHWDYGDPNPCEETFSGSQPFCEPETIAIRNFIDKFDRAYWKAYISVHSYGQYILYPYGYGQVVPDNINELVKIAQIAIEAIQQPYKTEYKICSIADMYLAPGVSIDWTRSIGIQYSYTIELRDTGKHAFLLPAKYIIPTAEELLNAIRVIAESAYRDDSKKSIS